MPDQITVTITGFRVDACCPACAQSVTEDSEWLVEVATTITDHRYTLGLLKAAMEMVKADQVDVES